MSLVHPSLFIRIQSLAHSTHDQTAIALHLSASPTELRELVACVRVDHESKHEWY